MAFLRLFYVSSEYAAQFIHYIFFYRILGQICRKWLNPRFRSLSVLIISDAALFSTVHYYYYWVVVGGGGL